MTTSVSGSSMSFASILTILFIALKLLHKIDWGWVWVLAPIWVPFALVLGILVVLGIVKLVGDL